MATLSVIVPVYNVEKYLPACLDSILKQTGFELEIILVDDGSTDASSQICDEYSKRDSRIRILHEPNRGVSVARNTGVSCATGEYVAFVDSDDELVPYAYQTCVSYIEEIPDVDCLIYGYHVIKNKKTYSVIPKAGYYTKSDFGDAYTELLLSFLINSPCNKIYKREVISSSGAFFPKEMDLGEDLIYNNRYLRKCQQVAVLDKVLYNYYYRDNGSLTTRYHNDLFTLYCCHWEDIMSTLSFFGEKIEDIRINSLFARYTRESINMLFHDQCPLTILNKINDVNYILNHSYTSRWILADTKKDFYWWLMKNRCTFFLIMYIYASKCKHRLIKK